MSDEQLRNISEYINNPNVFLVNLEKLGGVNFNITIRIYIGNSRFNCNRRMSA